MLELADRVTMKGNAVTLVGQKEIKVGDQAPDATVVANDLSEVKISSFKGKKLIISVVPSLDTGICDKQTKRFNKEATTLGNDVVVLTISVDLPFAQKRWCAATDSNNVKTLSDYRYGSFGDAYGLMIKSLRLLARAIYVVDQKGVVRYVQLVKEITTEPDYESVLKAVKSL